MTGTYAIEAWHDFALMIGGAAAALAGLLIVAMSINVDQILKFDDLPPRAAGALITMLSPLVLAIVLLIPGQSDTVLAVELVVLAVALGWVLLDRLGYRPTQGGQTVRQWLIGTGGPLTVLVVSLLLAGIGIGTGTIGGLAWLAPAVLAAVLSGTAQAWVLLIEIRR
ncbi:hypothetical protein [Dermatobacter hominis]|uniref:hypothetical protein n=1 Tax=Dermatobacter hominis TaxID=2884263 RepID=UPI001D12AD8A|nr:hypothetical protein [Dermatobacter hominis]UDY37306.1 hypothetical protein LH044_07155 [Dermatobacter hominis]